MSLPASNTQVIVRLAAAGYIDLATDVLLASSSSSGEGAKYWIRDTGQLIPLRGENHGILALQEFPFPKNEPLPYQRAIRAALDAGWIRLVFTPLNLDVCFSGDWRKVPWPARRTLREFVETVAIGVTYVTVDQDKVGRLHVESTLLDEGAEEFLRKYY